MKTICLVFVSALVLMAARIGYAAHTHDAGSGTDQKKARFTKHFNESLFQITDRGEFSVEILLDEKEYKIGKNVIGIVIHNKHDEDVEGAGITFALRDGQGQDITGSSVVKEKGDGLYIVADLDLRKEGKGELRVKVKKKALDDTAVFLFPSAMKERFPAGKYTEPK